MSNMFTLPGLIIVLLVLVLSTVCCGELRATPLCAEVHGFADEFNHHLLIPVPVAPSANEAIVLLARTFPMSFGMFMQLWLSLNVTYHLSMGATVTRVTGMESMLQLADVAAGSDIEVNVHSTRLDGPVPFVFYSYFANKPACFIAIDEANPFHGAVPPTLRVSSASESGGSSSSNEIESVPAKIYFETTLPAEINAVTINVIVNFEFNQEYELITFDSTNSLDKMQSTRHTSGDLLHGNYGQTFMFAVSPSRNKTHPDAHLYSFMSVSVEYGEWNEQQKGDKTEHNNGNTHNTNSPKGESSTANQHDTQKVSSGSSFATFLLIVVIMIVLYFAVMSYYNYTRLGKTEFPEMLPHSDKLVAFTRFCQICCNRIRGQTEPDNFSGYNEVGGSRDVYL